MEVEGIKIAAGFSTKFEFCVDQFLRQIGCFEMDAQFIKSAFYPKDFPILNLPEICFVGKAMWEIILRSIQ